jgi:hypothetical protein
MSDRLPPPLPQVSTRRPALAAFAAAFAAWTLLALGMPTALNESAPFAAAALLGGDAETRLAIARALEPPAAPESAIAPLDKQQAGETRATALAALAAAPLSAEAVRQIARALQQDGRTEAAIPLVRESFRRFFRQPDIDAQLLLESLKQNDFEGVVTYADAVIRTSPQFLPAMLPVLIAIGDQPASRPALIGTMRLNPPWRADFLAEYGKSPRTEDAFLDIYQALKGTPAALTPDEVRPFLFDLVNRDQADKALTIWLGTLSEETLAKLPLLYNGGFDLPVNDSPFNWYMWTPDAAAVRIAAPLDDPTNNALVVEFAGRRGAFYNVEQTLALTPGRYRVTGRFRSADFQNARGLVWRVYCGAKNARLIAESSRLTGEGVGWRSFQLAFETPTACPIQVLRLELAARIPAEQIATGSAWFDDLAIEKAR